MEDIVDYSKKLKEESKKFKKILIIAIVVVTIFAFSFGFYVSYSIKDNEDSDYSSKLDTIYEILKDEWYYGKEDENIEKTLIDRAIYGMLDTDKDPHTRYLTSLGSLASSYEGLGISVSEYKEYFVIKEVSSKVNIDSGFKIGDILKSIDGVDLANKSSEDIKSLIENKNQVAVVVERDGSEVNLTGYVTTYTPVTVFKDFSYSNELAYIQITEFARDTSLFLDEYLKEAKEKGYNKLILDLRDNPGGYISSVVECADLFLEKDKSVITTKDKEDNSYTYKTSSNDKYQFSKIIILINNNSASGAEALSAALNEQLGDIVDLVGVTTYGKGSAQKMIYFTDGTYFNYTYALWFTPNNNSINKVGVTPEVAYTGTGIHLLSFSKTTLKKNDYGANVANLQNILKELGYYNGEVHSFYSEEVETAVKAFQHDQGISETGELDALTIRYILALYHDSQVLDYLNEVNWVINNYRN